MKKLLLIQIFLLVGVCLYAQLPSISKTQLQQIRVENLSDEQIRQIVAEMKRNKITVNQIDSYAQQQGIPPSEVAKLKERIMVLNLEKELVPPNSNNSDQNKLLENEREMDSENITSARDIKPETIADKRRMRIFGAELFSNRNLTFEPNLRMATPPNYQLATGDELIIDVYGYSEVQHKLKVSPDGYIRIPYLGPVYVSGLTIEEAKTRITKQLTSIYGGIKSGNTFVQVSLGSIRSIRVLLIGEVDQPGSYTLPSLATVANALYVSGGPSENGSFRNIQVIRNGGPLIQFDLYDFLTNGDLTNNIVLRDQDIIKVNPYKTRVELIGQIKRPAIFEAKEGETLQDILNYAGGYTDISFKEVIRAYRITNREREVVNIPADQVSTFKLRSGDKFFVDSVLNRFTNRVTITGAVFHPGDYAIDSAMTVADLINRADGLKEEASLSRGIIFRLNDDYTPTSTGFNVSDVISGKETLPLKREDSIVIYSKLNLKEHYHIKVSGEVNMPGSFDFTEGLHIEDVILMAGGLKDAASLKKVEIARRIRNKDYSPVDSAIAIVAQFDISNDLSTVSPFVLQPFDEIIVRKSPTYNEQELITIEGEVLYPGAYTIHSKKEKISDLIRRAGGLKPEAYPEGALLLRKTFANESDSTLLDSKLQVFYNSLKDSSNIGRLQSAIHRKEQLLGINLKKILENPNSKFDLLLEEGDVIKIPKKLQTVQLFGEVYFPKKVRYDKLYNFRDYIRGAGGFTSQGMKRKSYIVYANGEVKSTKKILFFNSYPRVLPGAEIYVPARKEGKKLSGPEVVGISTGIASLALIIITVLDKIQ